MSKRKCELCVFIIQLITFGIIFYTIFSENKNDTKTLEQSIPTPMSISKSIDMVNDTGQVVYEIAPINEIGNEPHIEELEEVEEIIEPTLLGEFLLTAYCMENYPHICNNGDATVTATGTTPTEGRTIAVDPTVIPYGTEVVINGHTYIAEDTGGAINGNRIDICFTSHEKALEFGKQFAEVFIIERGVNE